MSGVCGAMILVQVRNAICGLELELGDVPSDACIGDLTLMLERHWQVHPRCQRFLLQGKLVANNDKVADLCPEGAGKLCIDVVVSLAGLIDDLLIGDHVRKESALQYLKGSRRGLILADVISELANRLMEDDDVKVRQSAASMLSELADRGDEIAIKALLAQLDDSQQDIRYSSVMALSRIATRGNRQTTAALSARLEMDEADHVRGAAAVALGKLAHRGDCLAVSAAIGCLEDGEQDIRLASIELLSKVAEPGDTDVVQELTSRLWDPDEDVRFAALDALCDVSARGDEAVITAVLPWLKEGDAVVRQAALRALSTVAEKSDATVMEALLPLLGDKDDGVRSAACAAWCQVAQCGGCKEDAFMGHDVDSGSDTDFDFLRELECFDDSGFQSSDESEDDVYHDCFEL